MSSDYTIHRTDPNNGQFVIKSYTTNGPNTPNNQLPLYPSAVSANTSLVLLGKGMFDYGEPIQTDLVHMLENFAGPTPPVYPLPGQLWFNNAISQMEVYLGPNPVTDWRPFMINGGFTSPLDLNHQRIINLGIPTNYNDATSLGYSDARYLKVDVPSHMNATVTFTGGSTITGIPLPVSALDVVNKEYVDNIVTGGITNLDNYYINKSGSIGITGHYVWDGTTIASSIMLNTTDLSLTSSTFSVANGTANFSNTTIGLSGTTFVGQISLSGNLVITGDRIIDVGSNRIRGVAAPINGSDAANKDFVVQQVIAGASYDGTLQSGVFNSTTGTLTLTSSVSGDVVITGFNTTQTITQTAKYNAINPVADNSWLATTLRSSVFYPNIPIQEAVAQIDVALSDIKHPRKRYIATVATPGVLTITLPFYYTTEMHSLMVTKNGIKQYNSTRGYSTVSFPNTGKITSQLPLTRNLNYTFSVTVDGGTAQTITVSNTSTTSFNINTIPSNITFTVTNDITNQLFANQLLEVVVTGAYSVCNGTYHVVSFTYDSTTNLTTITVLENNQVSTVPSGSGSPVGTITPTLLFTYVDMVNMINTTLTGAICIYDEHSIIIYSTTFGPTSTVSITDVTLFAALSTTGIVNGPAGVLYGYTENGMAYSQSNTITFIADPGVGAVIEILDTK